MTTAQLDLFAAPPPGGVSFLAPDNPIPNSLRVSNASRLTDELRSNIRSHREELIRYLSLPLFDRALMIFGGVEVDVNGRKIKPLGQPADGGLLALTPWD